VKAFKFKLYNHKRNRHLIRQIEIAAGIYNHCIALHKRYYRRYKKYLNLYQLKKHITKLKKRSKYAHWNNLGSQAIQDVCIRIDKAYQLFFDEHKKGNKTIRPPRFRKRRKYKSFTLTQAGYRILNGNYIRIGQHTYRYFKSRDIKGNVKTLTIKRDSIGDLYIIITTDINPQSEEVTSRTGKSVGFDFGLKMFLTASNGTDIESPLFFKQSINRIKQANRRLSTKRRASNSQRKARIHLAKEHRRIANQRNDFHWKLANQLTDKYDYLIFETLNLKGMQRLWGRKINDLGFYSFLQKVQYYANKKGKIVHFIDRFFPSSKLCSGCGVIYNELELRQRKWTCDSCGTTHDRDRNASLNIQRAGASALGIDSVRPTTKVGNCH